MELTKNQTIEYFRTLNKIVTNKNKYKYITKIETNCLKCKKRIYLSYFENSVKSVFCKSHQMHHNTKNIAQLQYLRLIKERQIKKVVL